MTDVAATETTQAQETPAAKVVQLRQAVQEKAGAVSDWAQDKAQALATTAKEKPLAAAGIGAGAAFAFGLVIGFLLSQSLPEPAPPSWRDRLMDLKPRW